MSKALKPNDAAFLFVEKQEQPVHVAVLAQCSIPKGAGESFLGDLVARWREAREFAPPFNYRLRMTPVPAWEEIEADEIDLEYHFRHSALPRPGGERELGILVSRLHTYPLSRGRPLWECHLIEGLDGGRFAFYLKMHHSQVDGVGGIRMLRRCLDADPGATDKPPPWEIGTGSRRRDPPPEDRSGADAERALPVRLGSSVAGAGRSAVAIAGATAGMIRQGVTGRVPEAAVPYAAPKTILNGRIHGPRRFATQNYELDRIKRVAKAGGATVNDVFLAICSGGLRRYLSELDALPEQSLTAAVPISIRLAGDSAVGNAISFLHARLETQVADPLERLERIRASTSHAKRGLERLPPGALNSYTLLSFGPYLTQVALGLGGRGKPAHNVVISNVPGPAEQLYLAGAPVEEMFPISLLFDGQALNISVLSYGGKFNLGFTGCRDSLPHMQRIAVYTGEALDELEAAVGA